MVPHKVFPNFEIVNVSESMTAYLKKGHCWSSISKTLPVKHRLAWLTATPSPPAPLRILLTEVEPVAGPKCKFKV